MQSTYQSNNSFQPLFKTNSFLVRFLNIIMRSFCGLIALWGMVVFGKYFIWQQSPKLHFNIEPLIANALPALIFAFLLSLAFVSILAIFSRRNKILVAEKNALQAKIATMRQNLANMAEAKQKAQEAVNPAQNGANLAKDLRLALNQLPTPIWLRDDKGHIRFANQAYLTIMQQDGTKATDSAFKNHQNGQEIPEIETLFSPKLQQNLTTARQQKQNFSGQTNFVLNGNRHIFRCQSFYDQQSDSFIEFAEDISEKLHLEDEIKRIQQGYAETFDCLSTSVAIFDPTKKLEFFNSAFASLWPLESQFLESNPSHTLVLDRLREKGILNERPDWREWKDNLFEAYHSLNPQHYIWNLPDGRTLRVVANPHPQGGVTWLFDDLTEKLTLQARYNTLIKMQGETLDNLSEGVAVFGSDGLLRLSNPAFTNLWELPAAYAVEGTHIEKIKNYCLQNTTSQLSDDQANEAWQNFVLYVTGFADKRDFASGRIELQRQSHHDSRIFDYMLVPLPEAQTMLTFVDVTDSVNIARALHERNTALESADKLRNDFVQHVSYELRTPLTNIIGFTDLMLAPNFGKLNSQQDSYLHHIADQSVTLLNLVNDILDLATVDAGIMELDISTISVAEVMDHAVERLKEPLKAKNITLDQHIATGLHNFEADKSRVRQIFINLLNNAIKAAPENSHIHFSAEKYNNYIAFIVEDEGPGIAPEYLNTIFKRFTSYAYGGHKTGVGLGLSIVKSFVELHQGHVLAETGQGNGTGNGTRLICRFPFHDNTIEQ